MNVSVAVWTYPWDVLDLGAETVASELSGRAGADAISLATSYHAGHFLQARSVKREILFPRRTVWFISAPIPGAGSGIAFCRWWPICSARATCCAT